jgi:hypothetical protein
MAVQPSSALVLASVLASTLLAAPRAGAQDTERPPGAHAVEPLASIETEADWAEALYVASLASTLGGLGLGLSVGFMALVFESAFLTVIATAGFVIAGVGVTLLPIAIGLDVDSGSRRSALRASARLGPCALAVRVDF